MARAVATLLMYDGVAEEAMKLYISLFSRSEIRRLSDTALAIKVPKAASREQTSP